jgi:lincosamide nucleotidyltransferase A/C/D/E
VTTLAGTCPPPMSALCWVSLTGQGLTASGLPAGGVSTHWLGIRPGFHSDLDLAVDVTQMALDHLLQAFGRHGYGVEADWRPSRVALVAGGARQVDVHPIVFDAQGTGWQANVEGQEQFRYPEDAFAQGLIDGRVVDCLSVAQQLRFHHGYIQRERDNHDIALLETLIGRARTT